MQTHQTAAYMIYIYYVISNYSLDILYDIVKINVQYLKKSQNVVRNVFFVKLSVKKMSPSECIV